MSILTKEEITELFADIDVNLKSADEYEKYREIIESFEAYGWMPYDVRKLKALNISSYLGIELKKRNVEVVFKDGRYYLSYREEKNRQN